MGNFWCLSPLHKDIIKNDLQNYHILNSYQSSYNISSALHTNLTHPKAGLCPWLDWRWQNQLWSRVCCWAGWASTAADKPVHSVWAAFRFSGLAFINMPISWLRWRGEEIFQTSLQMGFFFPSVEWQLLYVKCIPSGYTAHTRKFWAA